MSKELFSLAKQAQDYGWLKNITESVDGLVLGYPTDDWHKAAKFLSRVSGGQWLAYRHGVFWNFTGKRGWIMNPEAVPPMDSARRICQSVTGVTPSYSIGSAAREMLKFACPPDKSQANVHCTRIGAGIGYNECAPGTYDNMVYLDVKSCYFQLVSRLPSLHWRVSKGGTFNHQEFDKNTAHKWRDVLAAIATNKSLRNAVWGSMVGSLNESPYYHEGKLFWREPWDGDYQAAGNLVARLAWEMNIAAAYETDAVYAQTDCIICEEGKTPKTWENFGLEYSVKARGKAEIRRQHNYKIGTKKTKLFKPYNKWCNSNPRKDLPERWYCNELLASSCPVEINW